LARRLSVKEKEEIIKSFKLGKTIEDLSKEFKCTKLTISRNLKKSLDNNEYHELTRSNKLASNNIDDKKNSSFKKGIDLPDSNSKEKIEEISFNVSPFIEITPLDYEIENAPQKDFSSVPISEIKLPKIVFMIVSKNIELETKYLKDYPDWHFLSQDELNRKTIEIFDDIKNAKRFCNREQKVIKVPNTKIFQIVAPLLVSRGISRIINSGQLIAL